MQQKPYLGVPQTHRRRLTARAEPGSESQNLCAAVPFPSVACLLAMPGPTKECARAHWGEAEGSLIGVLPVAGVPGSQQRPAEGLLCETPSSCVPVTVPSARPAGMGLALQIDLGSRSAAQAQGYPVSTPKALFVQG